MSITELIVRYWPPARQRQKKFDAFVTRVRKERRELRQTQRRAYDLACALEEARTSGMKAVQELSLAQAERDEALSQLRLAKTIVQAQSGKGRNPALEARLGDVIRDDFVETAIDRLMESPVIQYYVDKDPHTYVALPYENANLHEAIGATGFSIQGRNIDVATEYGLSPKHIEEIVYGTRAGNITVVGTSKNRLIFARLDQDHDERYQPLLMIQEKKRKRERYLWHRKYAVMQEDRPLLSMAAHNILHPHLNYTWDTDKRQLGELINNIASHVGLAISGEQLSEDEARGLYRLALAGKVLDISAQLPYSWEEQFDTLREHDPKICTYTPPARPQGFPETA